VLIWNDASTLDGSPPPDLQIEVNGAQRLNHALVGEDDIMYLADGFNLIFAIDSVSGLTGGMVEPSRTLDGDDIISPDRLFFIPEGVE
jgi:hypothetical protein